tara:strand:+ start:2385 stop:3311 length:927 start_codon:yes stop_codon:yes gene_type:complete
VKIEHRELARNGWLVIDKPSGFTSFQVVKVIRKLYSVKKAGHAGTLDPLATGILPVALGEATKTIPYIIYTDKTYHFTVCWGDDRDTNDSDGRVIATSKKRPSEESILNILENFKGKFEQVPPDYSAIKVNGQRAYKLAREQKPVQLKARTVEVKSIKLLKIPDPDHAEFCVTTSKGFYVRSLARDLGLKLGTFGHIVSLRRSQVGSFYEKDSILLDSLLALEHSRDKFEALLPVERALDDIPALSLSESSAERLRCGQSISVTEEANWLDEKPDKANKLAYVTFNRKLLAVVALQDDYLKPIRIFNL